MSDKTKLQAIIDKVPGLSTEKAVKYAVRHFFREIDPDDLSFTRHPNGLQIKIKCDEENAIEAHEWWQENIEGKL